jgi:hypothetical protein
MQTAKPGGTDPREQSARACKRHCLVAEPGLEHFALDLAQPLQHRLIGIGKQRGDQHVGTLADLIMNALAVESDADRAESRLPGKHVQVVAVDQRPSMSSSTARIGRAGRFPVR